VERGMGVFQSVLGEQEESPKRESQEVFQTWLVPLFWLYAVVKGWLGLVVFFLWLAGLLQGGDGWPLCSRVRYG